MNSLIPTIALVAIFAATVFGCQPERNSPPPEATEEATSSVIAPRTSAPTVEEAPPQLTSAAVPTTPKSVFNKPIAPPPTPTPSSGEVAVRRMALSRGVENREPIEPGTLFDSKEAKLYAFVEAANPSTQPGLIYVTFVHESGKSAGHVELEIPAQVSRWRTWAYSRVVREPGAWTATVADEEGTVIDAIDFEILDPIDR